MNIVSKNPEETRVAAFGFVKNLTPVPDRATVVGLYGELGAGKTTFMKYVAEALGVADTIQSPTFVIEKVYEISHPYFSHLIHIDAYRIEEEKEMLTLGWEALTTDPKHLICVEWPERIKGVIGNHQKIFFTHAEVGGSDTERTIDIQ